MSEVNANFVVESVNLSIDQSDPGITVQPEVINMTLYTAGYANPGGNVGDLQYNAGGYFNGIPTANYIGGNLSLGNVNAVKLLGGSNAYFLQTDGTGNLTWAPGTINANTGNGIPVGANTQIQITDGTGNFVSAPGFTFNYVSNALTVPGDVYAQNYYGNFMGNIANGNSNIRVFANSNIAFGVSGNANVVLMTGTQLIAANANLVYAEGLTANFTTITGLLSAGSANQPNITGVGTLTNLTVNGNITSVSGKYFGDGSGLSNITPGNINGQVSNALVAGTVYTNAQPNITSVGNLSGLTVTGVANFTGNINVTSTATVQQIKEKVVANSTGSTGTVSYDLLTSAIIYKTNNATANWNIDFRGNSTQTLNNVMSSNESITCTYINTNGSTPYVLANISVDGTATTPIWSGPNANVGTGTINGKDMYTFNIIKTAANTYTVFASRNGFV
jgi:hypothetical protein